MVGKVVDPRLALAIFLVHLVIQLFYLCLFFTLALVDTCCGFDLVFGVKFPFFSVLLHLFQAFNFLVIIIIVVFISLNIIIVGY